MDVVNRCLLFSRVVNGRKHQTVFKPSSSDPLELRIQSQELEAIRKAEGKSSKRKDQPIDTMNGKLTNGDKMGTLTNGDSFTDFTNGHTLAGNDIIGRGNEDAERQRRSYQKSSFANGNSAPDFGPKAGERQAGFLVKTQPTFS